jgi:hypothetical protein
LPLIADVHMARELRIRHGGEVERSRVKRRSEASLEIDIKF